MSRIKNSEYFYIASSGFFPGLLLISYLEGLHAPSSVLYFILLLVSLLLFIFVETKNKKLVFLFLVFFLLAFWRYDISLYRQSPDHIDNYNGSELSFQAEVMGDVIRDRDKQKFTVEVLASRDKDDISGKVLVYSAKIPLIKSGDLLQINCELTTPEPFDGFAYDRYLAKDKIYSICFYGELDIIARSQNLFTYLYMVKDGLRQAIDRSLNSPGDSIARALLLGDSFLIEEDLREKLSRSGISHIMAISGLHIGIIASIITILLFTFGLWRSQVYLLSAGLLFLFVVLVGAPSSALRAWFMLVLGMYALYLGRLKSLDRIVIFSACCMLLLNPKLLRDDIGFQLSFLAVLGIIYFAPLINRYLKRIKALDHFKLRELVSVTMAAQISTLAIAAFYFGTIPIFGLFSNLLILWTLPIILVLLILDLISYFLLSGLYIFAAPLGLLLDYINKVSLFFGDLQFFYLEGEYDLNFVLVYYLLLFVVYYFAKIRVNTN